MRARFKVGSKVESWTATTSEVVTPNGHTLKEGDQNDVLKHRSKQDKWVALGKENSSALPTVERVFRDLKEDPIVRHEAAETMGAIVDAEYTNVERVPERRETGSEGDVRDCSCKG